jgi:hypothetical protein
VRAFWIDSINASHFPKLVRQADTDAAFITPAIIALVFSLHLDGLPDHARAEVRPKYILKYLGI